ncbi:MAG TPA: TonB-dependent receptor [Rhodothermales bacterium]|nr:TonB-dependent receptor [Rhodothermales bacterium]
MRRFGTALALAWTLTFPLVASAQTTTGKIAGRVVDATTKEPLPGVNVVVEGTVLGAATGLEGEYVILNVAPGTYRVSAAMLGYRRLVKEGAAVSINRTTTLNFDLTSEDVEGSEVEVVANRPEALQRDVSFSTSYVRAEDIQAAPARNVEEVLSRQAGITRDDFGLQIRGLSETDIAVYVDGMSYNDNRNDRPYTNINFDAISEIEILTGGFSAEYGNARGGVLNLTTKEDFDRYTGTVRFSYSPAGLKHFGPNAFSADNWWDWGRFQSFAPTEDRNQDGKPDFMGWNAYSADRNLNVYNLSPENNKRLWDYQHRTDILRYGDRPDYSLQASVGGPLFPWTRHRRTSFNLGVYKSFDAYAYQLSVPGVENENVDLRLTHQFNPRMKLRVFGLYTRDLGAGYRINNQHDYISDPNFIIRYNLMNSGQANTLFAVENLSNNISWRSWTGGARWTHMLSPRTFYEVRAQGTRRIYSAFQPADHPIDGSRSAYKEFFFLADRDGVVRGFPAFPRYYSYHYSTFTTDQNGYWLHRIQHSRTFDKSWMNSGEVKMDLTSQVTNQHMVKVGIGSTLDHIDEWRYAYGLAENGLGGYQRAGEIDDTQWNARILHGYAYGQDKMEFEGFVVNAGLRLDYYKPLTPAYDLSNDWTTDSLLTVGARERFLANMPKKVPALRAYLSPRLGIAHPITTDSKIYFNYGHFVDIPDPNTLYWIQLGTIERLEAIGNPDLKLPRSVLYEVGYEHVLNPSRHVALRANVSAYMRDIRGDVDEVDFSFSPSLAYATFRNSEYEETRGVELKLDYRLTRLFRGFVNFERRYTLRGYFGPDQIRPDDPLREAENAALEAKGRARNTIEPNPTLKASLSLLSPEHFGPRLLGFAPLAGWVVTLDYNWRRGTPFHWDPTGTTPEHELNWRWRDYHMSNLRVARDFAGRGNTRLQLYADVTNVFNIRNFNVGTYGAGLSKGSYSSPGDPSYVFAAFGLDANEEFNAYMRRIEELGRQPGDAVEYAYMPKREYVTYLNPRDVRFGMRVTF